MKAANLLQTAESVYLFLVDRVRANMHIVLCFSPIGDEFRYYSRTYVNSYVDIKKTFKKFLSAYILLCIALFSIICIPFYRPEYRLSTL